MGGPLDTPPSEPGWWLASDGKWYSPQQAPGPVPYAPRPTLRDRISVAGWGFVASMFALGSLAGFACFGWDASTVDAHGAAYPEPSSVEVALRLGGIALVAAVLTVLVHARGPRVASTLLGAFDLGLALWIAWRGSVGRVHGANMFMVAVFFVTAEVVVVEFGTHAVLDVARRHRRRRG